MRFVRPMLAVLGLWTAAPAAALDGDWVVLDLGPSRSESVCVDAASQAFVQFGRAFGIQNSTFGKWTIYGYGLDDDQTDAIVTCTFSTANSARATLILYSTNQIAASLIAGRFEGYFTELNKRLGDEWLQRAFDRNNM